MTPKFGTYRCDIGLGMYIYKPKYKKSTTKVPQRDSLKISTLPNKLRIMIKLMITLFPLSLFFISLLRFYYTEREEWKRQQWSDVMTLQGEEYSFSARSSFFHHHPTSHSHVRKFISFRFYIPTVIGCRLQIQYDAVHDIFWVDV